VNVTAYFSRDPQELVVEVPEDQWPAVVKFLQVLGFKKFRGANLLPVPGKFRLKFGNVSEFEKVLNLTREGCEYLSCGNCDYGFDV